MDYSALGVSSISDIKSTRGFVSFGLRRPLGKYEYSLGAIAQYRKYQRDIASTQRLFGLNETYRYQDLGLFVELQRPFANKFYAGAELSYFKSIDADVNVEFLSRQFDQIEFGMGSTYLTELNSHLGYELTPNINLEASISYTYQESSRSDRAPLFEGGEQTNSFVTQPYTEKEVVSFGLKLKYTF